MVLLGDVRFGEIDSCCDGLFVVCDCYFVIGVELMFLLGFYFVIDVDYF